jgi:hypothetical protein
MVTKYNNFFHSKALQIYPNWYFWFENKPSGNPALNANKHIGRFFCFVFWREFPPMFFVDQQILEANKKLVNALKFSRFWPLQNFFDLIADYSLLSATVLYLVGCFTAKWQEHECLKNMICARGFIHIYLGGHDDPDKAS